MAPDRGCTRSAKPVAYCILPKPLRGQDFTRIAGRDAYKNEGGSWFAIAHNTTSGKGQNPDGRKIADGRKGAGAEWFDQNLCQLPSASPRRKAASALIAKIPEPLARHIARTFKP